MVISLYSLFSFYVNYTVNCAFERCEKLESANIVFETSGEPGGSGESAT